MNRKQKQFSQWDKKYVWHPFTQQSDWKRESPLIVESAQGAYFRDLEGKKYIDGVSSLWVTVHGHNHPVLNKAFQQQLKKMAHTTFLGLSHRPAIELAKSLVEITPKNLNRVFYSDSGATSVEIALKMAYQYWAQKKGAYQRQNRRTEFLALKNSYHGDTIGSVSVGGIDLFQKKFKSLLFKTHFAMSPSCYHCPFRKKSPTANLRNGCGKTILKTPRPGDKRGETGCRWECLKSVESILKKQGQKIAAAVIEPMVQGAAGIVVMPEGYLKGFERLCRKYEILLIADEVATGFGRTGKMFAVDQEGVKPDLMCLAKSITGGYFPLAATMATEKIYSGFLGRYDEFKSFFHGHTYTANPLGCSVAMANLALYKSSRLIKNLKNRSDLLSKWLNEIKKFSLVGNVRQMGMMAGIELVQNKETQKPFLPREKVGQKVCLAARAHGVWVRPLGDVIVLMPHLAMPLKDFKKLLNGIRLAIQTTII